MNSLLLGYNTNGFAHHSLEDALTILRELAYDSVALTLDYHHLNPFDPDELSKQVSRIRPLLTPLLNGAVIETGARFLLDPRRKHQPTLLSASPSERERRLDFLFRSVDLAAELGIGLVSFWSGQPDANDHPQVLMERLVQGCRRLSDHAARHHVRLAFEPEPGMWIETMDQFAILFEQVRHPAFGLTLDLGHLHCLGELPIESHLGRWKDRLWNIHIEDMKQGVHEHLMFGEGEMDFRPIIQGLREIGYSGALHVELSRHSHDAVETACKAHAFLRAW